MAGTRFAPAGALARASARSNTEHSDDSEYIRAVVASAKAGDRDALQFLYIRYADAIYGYVCSVVRDKHEAEDVTQQVFIRLMRVIGQYEERSVPFIAWLLRVSRNVALNHIRSNGREIPADEIRNPAVSHRESGAPERRTAIREALATLPAEQRSVVVLRHIAGLAPGQIAGVLGKTECSVHGLHNRGRKAMAEALAERDVAPVTAVDPAA